MCIYKETLHGIISLQLPISLAIDQSAKYGNKNKNI